MVKRKFNWDGITENEDGTFNADGKRAKTRLLKEFHRQGISVRSSKIEGDGYKIYSVGIITKKRTIPRFSQGYRPRTTFMRTTNRLSRLRSPPRLRGRPINYPSYSYGSNYRTSPHIRGPSIAKQAVDYLKQRKINREIDAKNMEKHKEKMLEFEKEKLIERNQRENAYSARHDFMAKEMKRAESGYGIQRQNEARSLRARLRDEQQTEKENLIHKQQEQRKIRHNAAQGGWGGKAPQIPEQRGGISHREHIHIITTGTGGQTIRTNYEPKIDQGVLQAARDEQVTGG